MVALVHTVSLAVLSLTSVAALQSSSKPKLRVERKVDNLQAKMAEMEEEIETLTDQVSNLASPTSKIHSTDSLCTVSSPDGLFGATLGYGGSYHAGWSGEEDKARSIDVTWKKDGKTIRIECADSETNTSGMVEKSAKEIERAFSKIIPFADVLNKIKQGFKSDMSESKCRELVAEVPGYGSINKFLDDNIAEVLKLIAEQEGEVKTL
ncbi:hypothetical protein FOZ63_004770 [Perkinsus olseni]|uniref:Uncharacterized protein n=1 Tax=Perkinsus olseni TaxID=32597 RepID=A0A7J6TS73_PEROL|nr:hypothetical protein FOZ62_026220 [Perkinsus olseni]KAF4747925.1 hypothetical protein FOZ63_004770 [Perkinsus olseni]